MWILRIVEIGQEEIKEIVVQENKDQVKRRPLCVVDEMKTREL